MTFRPHTAGLNQAITSICWVGLFVPPWLPNKTGHYPLWDEVKFIDWDPHCYSSRVKEAIHIRLHRNNINKESEIEIPEAWMPTIKRHNSRSLPQRIAEGSVFSSDTTNNASDRNPPPMSEVRDSPITNNHGGTNSPTQQIDTITWWRPAVSGQNVAIKIKVTIVKTNDKLNPVTLLLLHC